MSDVPERDLVDKALSAARETAKGIASPEGSVTPGTIARDLALVLTYCTEAIVRQIRDTDDDVYQVARKIEASGADAVVALDGFTAAIQQIGGKR